MTRPLERAARALWRLLDPQPPAPGPVWEVHVSRVGREGLAVSRVDLRHLAAVVRARAPRPWRGEPIPPDPPARWCWWAAPPERPPGAHDWR